MSDILGVLGGLALFLYGMQMMSSGLEAVAGARMKNILQRLTSNRFLGVIVGALITAVIQSSSATTVMVVGFVNAGMMTLNQAVWVIMGANIGTTITALLITLDVGALAPLIAFIGVAMVVFVKKEKVQNVGQILAGFGVLFIGMGMMSTAMMPLRESEAFISIMSTFSNPLLAILAGAVFTALIQSSSASVGILQSLVLTGVLPFSNAVFVLFGQNIGTCITSVLAAMGTGRNAKRTTIIHLLFNVIGTTIFTVVCLIFPVASWIEAAIPNAPMAQIAAMHALFNIATTILLMPFGNYLAKLAVRILPDLPQEEEEGMHLEFLAPVQMGNRDGGLGTSAIYISQIRQEIRRMLIMTQGNVEGSFQCVLDQDGGRVADLAETEEYIDYLNKEISLHISRAISVEANNQHSRVMSHSFTIVGNVERIGDHADNVAGYTKMLIKKDISFSPAAMDEIKSMQAICVDGMHVLLQQNRGNASVLLTKVAGMEQRIDDMTVEYRRNHLERMRQGLCSDEACIIYAELLTDFERIGDHLLNIAEETAAVWSTD